MSFEESSFIMSHELNQAMASYENDFTVILVDGDGKHEEIHTHGVKLASVSRYFDAALKAGNFEESQSRELVLEDISIEAFHEAFEYLDDPAQIRTMETAVALEVFPIYDRLDMPRGLKLCSTVFESSLDEVLRYQGNDVGVYTQQRGLFDLIIPASVYAMERKLDCLPKALSVWERLLSGGRQLKFCYFTAEIITRLVPLIEKFPDRLMPYGSTLEDLQEMPAKQFGRYALRGLQDMGNASSAQHQHNASPFSTFGSAHNNGGQSVPFGGRFGGGSGGRY